MIHYKHLSNYVYLHTIQLILLKIDIIKKNRKFWSYIIFFFHATRGLQTNYFINLSLKVFQSEALERGKPALGASTC